MPRSVSDRVRVAIYVALLLALAAGAPEMLRTALAAAASVVLEAMPYLGLSQVLALRLGRYGPWAAALAGCGCTRGPGARSIPAAIAAYALFGPWVALARWSAACAVALVRRCDGPQHAHPLSLLDDVGRLGPPAVLCGLFVALAPALNIAHRTPIVQLLLGTLAGVFAAPCALGGVALAASLHAQSTLAADAVLATAGIIDVASSTLPHPRGGRDRVAYVLLALACALAAWMHGAALVHPRLTLPLFACAIYCAICAVRASAPTATGTRAIAGALVAVIVIGAPAPHYSANEATLAQLFPGERIDFTGVATSRERLVRYAITCCRADAEPVALPLAQPLSIRLGRWARIQGIVERDARGLRVRASSLRAVAPPADPFVYR